MSVGSSAGTSGKLLTKRKTVPTGVPGSVVATAAAAPHEGCNSDDEYGAGFEDDEVRSVKDLSEILDQPKQAPGTRGPTGLLGHLYTGPLSPDRSFYAGPSAWAPREIRLTDPVEINRRVSLDLLVGKGGRVT